MEASIKQKRVLAAGAIAVLLFYFIFDPLENSWMPQCLFHKFTGLQCMGCGSQRVLHSLLHGDIKGAVEANVFLVISLPALLFLLFVEIYRKRYTRLYRYVHRPATIIIISAILLGWLILRNILGI